ncbi:polyprotein, partial [Neisseria meningitidis]|nr:polyprotein [Neisseria meningitidis]MBG8603637.1 polyprotein [Neisseria meningitidis]MBG8643386.1 polyprotein [Neisseria meningitidis]MBG8744123.1 polyprotein [Neisseria meningitidis]MBG8766520.1 polyprotein [Neisseria meningitidis]
MTRFICRPSRKTQKMPSENLSDGIFACKSVEDFTPADS